MIRAQLIRATIWLSGMAKSRIARGGMAPPQGLMRPARSSISTECPARGEVVGRGGAGGAAADDDDVECLAHASASLSCVWRAGAPILHASAAEATKSSASATNTMP